MNVEVNIVIEIYILLQIWFADIFDEIEGLLCALAVVEGVLWRQLHQPIGVVVVGAPDEFWTGRSRAYESRLRTLYIV